MLRKALLPFTSQHFQIRRLPTLRERANPPEPFELYEPRFEVERHYPDIPQLDIRLQSHDFQPLEKFQCNIHWAARKYKIDVIESYALASKTEQVKEYRPGSTLTIIEYDLKTYNRIVSVGPVYAIQLPLFVMFIQANIPVGVQITLKYHREAEVNAERYIPDPQLEDFKETLRNLDNQHVRKLLGWEA